MSVSGEEEVYMRRQNCYVLCCILVVLFTSGCAVNGDAAHPGFNAAADVGKVLEGKDGHGEETLPDISPEAGVSETVAASLDEGQRDVCGMESAEKRWMFSGQCELGCGWWVYSVPEQEELDYKIYFFSGKNGDDMDKSFDEMDFDLGQADYVFPDAREGNIAIGKFTEMYLYEPFVMESGESAWIIIASYERDGRKYYDTRIYKWSGDGFVIDKAMTEELNALYSDAEEYPVLEVIEMPHD